MFLHCPDCSCDLPGVPRPGVNKVCEKLHDFGTNAHRSGIVQKLSLGPGFREPHIDGSAQLRRRSPRHRHDLIRKQKRFVAMLIV